MIESVSRGHLHHILRSRPSSRRLIVFETIDEAMAFEELQEDALLFYPWEILPFEPLIGDKEKCASRYKVVHAMLTRPSVTVITSVMGLYQKMPPASLLSKYTLTLSRGLRPGHEELIRKLTRMGYDRVYEARYPGQFAVRGEIIDVFSPVETLPVRCLFWDEEIENLRFYNPDTQMTASPCREAVIYPLREILYDESLAFERLKERIPVLEFMNRETYDGMERDFPLIYEDYSVITDFLDESWEAFLVGPPDPEVVFREKVSLMEKVEEDISGLLSFYRKKAETKTFLPVTMQEKTMGAEVIPGPLSDKELIQKITLWQKEGFDIHFYMDNPGQLKRFKDNFTDYLGSLTLHVEPFSGSYLDRKTKAAHLSEDEILGRYLEHKNIEYAAGVKKKENLMGELREGDFIVHVDYGIGIYGGVVNETIAGRQGDYVVITYKDNGRIYVPIDHLDKIEKYIGDQKSVHINALNDTAWKKTKSIVKNKIREFALDLLSLQAERQMISGIRFSPDTSWQKDFEESFIYKATPDQDIALREIKGDMESEKVMERLLCGDVGFGKTEVAVRAAFKAVQDGKQVALLCPTTVLAIQHYRTFRERMAEYPVSIAMLSRLVAPARAREIKKEAETGGVDIIIGTHKILMGNMRFKDLGLLIIDEEQRFGVLHKEKLKYEKKNIDTLVLSATPIPRTLYMSLTGIMDLSRLETPPKNRHPIRTRAIPFDEALLREIIFREVRRKGQVFFIHNRIKDIESIKQKIDEITMKQLKTDFVHGQMPAREIESRILRFMNRETDILLSTTIIENGIDIPNVNTVIINEADKFGLSQLYQIRGRVGRRETQAYAYLIVPPQMNTIAKERVNALLNFDYLGAGFEIAMRDLELRGAGNIIGKEQSGYMNMIGYDLYRRLLEEIIAELQGRELTEPVKVTLDLDIAAYLPDDYVEEGARKIEFYKKIYGARSEEELSLIKAELEDRYGKLPDEAADLFRLASLRLRAEKCFLHTVEVRDNKARILFTPDADPGDIFSLVEKWGRQISFDASTARIKAQITAVGTDSLSFTESLIEALEKGRAQE
ncbi:transcription-repair coupling factor [Candidatus Mcinerneyibacteriota bacterium]|nr:transcription-repair coupling factor [Candidatus Mcinerneyibacteriota bacterium]